MKVSESTADLSDLKTNAQPLGFHPACKSKQSALSENHPVSSLFRMKQKIFSDKVFQFLTKEFPEFTQLVKYQTDDSFDCELESPSRKFGMWIATYNNEITFGLKSPTGETDIHTHVGCYEEEDIEDCLSALTKLINDIKSNKVILYKDESNTFDWIDINRLTQKESKKQMTFEKILWDEKKR